MEKLCLFPTENVEQPHCEKSCDLFFQVPLVVEKDYCQGKVVVVLYYVIDRLCFVTLETLKESQSGTWIIVVWKFFMIFFLHDSTHLHYIEELAGNFCWLLLIKAQVFVTIFG